MERERSQLSDEERNERGLGRLSPRLGEALDALERDDVLVNALGPALAHEYLLVTRAEIRAYAEKDTSFELQQHSVRF